MNSTHASSPAQGFSASEVQWNDFRGYDAPAVEHAGLRPDRAKWLVDAFKRNEQAPRHLDEGLSSLDRDDSFGPLELATRTFRYLREREFRRKAAICRAALRASKEAYATLVAMGAESFVDAREDVIELEGSARWYEGRAAAQLPRFDTVRTCGTRSLRVNCRVCADDLCAPIPCRCGVVRVCDACATDVALKRRKRLAAARLDAIVGGFAAGLFIRKRRGGRFTEKMLTLTPPHIEVSELWGAAAEACEGYGLRNTVNARITVLRLAWPKFLRRYRRYLKIRDAWGAEHLAYYRMWEWTRGSDRKGHPHFHVYLFSQYVDDDLMREWWGDALESIGCPRPATPIIEVKQLYGFNVHAIAELVKAGDKRAIESRLGSIEVAGNPGLDAIRYASGWSMADAFQGFDDESMRTVVDVRRDLYVALEGRRLAQGSRGFLLPRVAPSCLCCGASLFSAKVLDFDDGRHTHNDAAPPHEGRGPP